jgi:hypothetical protein
MWANSASSGRQKPPISTMRIGFVWRLSWAQVSCSTSSSTVPTPPGKAMNASARSNNRLLAFVHVLDDQHLLDIRQRMLLADEKARNDPGDIAAGGQRRPGEAPHQPFAAAAVDNADPLGRERAPELFSRAREPRVGAVAGPAIDANVSNRAHVSICRPGVSAVKTRTSCESSMTHGQRRLRMPFMSTFRTLLLDGIDRADWRD